MSARSAVRYAWSHHGPIAPTSESGNPALLDTTCGTPATEAARAIARSPSGVAARCSEVGAIPNGWAYGVPSSRTEVSTAVTSRSACGDSRTRRHASPASAALVPSPDPVAK